MKGKLFFIGILLLPLVGFCQVNINTVYQNCLSAANTYKENAIKAANDKYYYIWKAKEPETKSAEWTPTKSKCKAHGYVSCDACGKLLGNEERKIEDQYTNMSIGCSEKWDKEYKAITEKEKIENINKAQQEEVKRKTNLNKQKQNKNGNVINKSNNLNEVTKSKTKNSSFNDKNQKINSVDNNENRSLTALNKMVAKNDARRNGSKTVDDSKTETEDIKNTEKSNDNKVSTYLYNATIVKTRPEYMFLYSEKTYTDIFKRVTKLPENAIVKVIRDAEGNDNYCYVSYNGVEGYISKNLLIKEEEKGGASEQKNKANNKPSVVDPTIANANDYTMQSGTKYPLMIKIEGGSFIMGTNDRLSYERPAHKETVNDFLLGKFLVTYGQFAAFIKETDYRTDAEKTGKSIIYQNGWVDANGVNWRHDEDGNLRTNQDYNKPVFHVSWNDAVAYCRWLSNKTQRTYRLPTEAEWEFAANGGMYNSSYKYSGSNTIDDVAWYGDNSGGKTHQVGLLKSNILGLFDMSGNVWEWINDDWYENYELSSQTDKKHSNSKVRRGGSWLDPSVDCLVTQRWSYEPYFSICNVGFRVACTQ